MTKKANDFNKVAWCYDALSRIVFGNRLKNSQLLLLDHIKEGDRLLIMGGGTGWILSEILKRRKVSEIDYIESSERMLDKAKSIPLDTTAKINFIHGDENSIDREENYDCIIAFYFFDLFTKDRLGRMIPLITSVMKHGGKLLIADFYLTHSSSLLHKGLIKIMYSFFRITCNIESAKLEPFRSVLEENKLHPRVSVSNFGGLILSEVYVFG